MNRILVWSCVILSVAIVIDCQNGVGGQFDPGWNVPTGRLNKFFKTLSEWYQNLDSRVQSVEAKFSAMRTNDPAHEARRLGAMSIINNLRAELRNQQFYISQQGVAPYYHVKRMETQLNSLGFGYLNGIWKVTRCGQGIYWHMCGELNDMNGR